jgi:hypothetical protein
MERLMHTRRVDHLKPTQRSTPPEQLQGMLQFTGLDQWLHLGTTLYGNTTIRMVTSEQEQGSIDGYLAMHEISHPLFGHYLCSSPYGSYGGLGYLTSAARDALLEEVVRIVQTKKLQYAVVRFRDPHAIPPERWLPDHSYCLTPSPLITEITSESLSSRGIPSRLAVGNCWMIPTMPWRKACTNLALLFTPNDTLPR